MQHRFSQVRSLYHDHLVSKIGVNGILSEATVIKPKGLFEAPWTGKWVIGLRGEGKNEGYPMDYRLGVRYTKDVQMFEEKPPPKEEVIDEDEQKQVKMLVGVPAEMSTPSR